MERSNEPANKPRRCFAAMEPEKQKEIASKGGRRVTYGKKYFIITLNQANCAPYFSFATSTST